ncbi:MAG: adenylyltransferase/cytidyltransferase family protein [Chloroflexi bacterium]|nr:adenylyltransferase/cytidyltransferase family protein [Chloroflexota bacterium]
MTRSERILRWDTIDEWSRGVRSSGARLVLTNGVFDLVHAGHVRYLEAARNLGDRLLVGINSDESTRALKGPERPIIPEAERAELIAALRCVDAAVVFPETTAHVLIRRVRPDVWVKGGDYGSWNVARQRLPEAPLVEELGIRAVILPFVEGRSTSALLERIRER